MSSRNRTKKSSSRNNTQQSHDNDDINNPSTSTSTSRSRTTLSQDNTSMNDISRMRRVRYVELIKEIDNIDDSAPVTADMINKIDQVVDEAGQMLRERKREKQPTSTEAVLSSKLFSNASDVVRQCVSKVDSNANSYNPSDLAQLFKAGLTIHLTKRIPQYSFLYGTFAAGPPIEKQRKPRKAMNKRQTQATLRKPETVQELHQDDEILQRVRNIKKKIVSECKRTGTPADYFRIIIDPTSFTKTVENCYHSSFLVRDNEIEIEVDETDGRPKVKPVPQHVKEARMKNNNLDNNQCVLYFDMENFPQMVAALNL